MKNLTIPSEIAFQVMESSILTFLVLEHVGNYFNAF